MLYAYNFTGFYTCRSRPKKVIKSLLRNIAESTAFISTMVFLAKYTVCILRNLDGRPPPLPAYIAILSGFSTGLATLLERKNRRKELCLFTIPHTLYALYLWGRQSGVIMDIPHGSVVLFSICMASIMYAFEEEPESISMLLNGLLKYFVGTEKISGKHKEKQDTVSAI